MGEGRKCVLVTGASGFIGGHTCEALAARGWDVRAMVRKTSDTSHLGGPGITLVYGDLSDAESMKRACVGVDTVVHTAAAVGSFGEWPHFYETGVLGTERLIDAAAGNGVRRFVHVSSIAVYGLRGGKMDEDTPFETAPQGWNHYVREKVMSEESLWKAHRAGKIRATSIRPSVVIGARDRNAVPRMADLLRLPVAALPGRPEMRFPVVTVEDCVDVIVRAVENDHAIGRAYNVAGDAIGLADIYALVAKHAKLPAPKVYLPTKVAIPAVGMLEGAWKLLKRPGEPVATRIAIVCSGYDYDVDTSRARTELGWRPNGSYDAAVAAAMAQPSQVRPGTL